MLVARDENFRLPVTENASPVVIVTAVRLEFLTSHIKKI